MGSSTILQDIYDRLFRHFGPQHWWPAESRFEVLVGAILTQNTNWGNVEKALDNLKSIGRLDLTSIAEMPHGLLAEYIRPAGYYNLKAKRLANLLALITTAYQGDLELFFAEETAVLREQLLSVKGVGPETADSILLYACNRPVFVIDAYTFRILARHGFELEGWEYAQLQELFMDNLPADAALYNEYHALLVQVGKDFCKKNRPHCEGCPLQGVHLS
ncbi:MAG: endonuclease [Desulfobulbus propionicus]|nr:MAG: endonuclease [Desulfobulbus propionicus]